MSRPRGTTFEGRGDQGPMSLVTADLPQMARGDSFDVVVNALQQRELLEPCLLLSAGYVGAPFFLHQARLLLSPLLAILGLFLDRQKEPDALSQ